MNGRSGFLGVFFFCVVVLLILRPFFFCFYLQARNSRMRCASFAYDRHFLCWGIHLFIVALMRACVCM